MGLLSLQFLLLHAVSLFLYHLHAGAAWRRSVVTLSSLVFVLSYADGGLEALPGPHALRSLSAIVGFALLGYGGLLAVDRWKAGGPAGLARGFVALVALKRGLPFVGVERSLCVTVGLSYVLLRVLHLILDRSQGELKDVPRFGRYCSYLFFFPTFLAGPIWRYEEYVRELTTPAALPLTRDGAFRALSRVANGLLKVAVLGEVALYAHQAFAGMLLADAGVCYALAAMLYLLYIYFDFSGYMDVVVGVAALYGVTLPENFVSPLQSRDVLDFWNRWHATLSRWMQQYLFVPVVAFLTRRYGSKARTPYIGAVGYFTVFLAVGAWHDLTWRFLAFGAGLGLLASATKVWDVWIGKRLGRTRAGLLRDNPLYRRAMNCLALFAVAVALSTVWVQPSAQAVLHAGSLAASLAVGALAALFLSVLGEACGAMDVRLGRLAVGDRGEWTARGIFGNCAAQTWLAARALLVTGVLLVRMDDIPSFVYQGF